MRKRTIVGILVVMMVVSMGIVYAGGDTTGNGAPKEKKLYQMNIIGVSNPKTVDMKNTSGHVIFVHLNKKSVIKLKEGPDFAILDRNGTDKDGAKFQLPDPGLDPYLVGGELPNGIDTISDYSVFVRPLGKPGGYATITTCAELVDSNFAGLLSGKFLTVLNRAGFDGGYASVEQVGQDITLRTKGKQVFQNVTAELLTIVFKIEVELADTTTIVEYVRVPIFSDIIENEYWEYDNHGLKLLQVRFYEVGTDISQADDPASWDELP
jgi:hypothetical protein